MGSRRDVGCRTAELDGQVLLVPPAFSLLELAAAADAARAAKLLAGTRPQLLRATALCIRLAAAGVIVDFLEECDLAISRLQG